MKSRKEYFHLRKTLMLTAFVLYALSFFLFQLCFLMLNHAIVLFAIMSLLLMFAVICSILAHRNKAFLFCPKCGSDKIVKATLFGIPDSIAEECPDCHAKIELNKPVNQD